MRVDYSMEVKCCPIEDGGEDEAEQEGHAWFLILESLTHHHHRHAHYATVDGSAGLHVYVSSKEKLS